MRHEEDTGRENRGWRHTPHGGRECLRFSIKSAIARRRGDMSYATYDFVESLDRVCVNRESIKRVVRAWGAGDGMGDGGPGYKWSEKGITDWKGGFLCEMQDGSYRYISGWCDYTGWGCQDGAIVVTFDHA